ncbi:hypothetical protein [Mesorhizobium sp. M00.F.Ca.ET.217.01.1.1]|uniref:hypothetical protein n=1 Tax=Mesorhizobium sp. M00.F.Ca.ET.217.01.1.1 TaxID=2500529 RepID=UPI000FDC2993|nr:hypothetical protein [Mesorhizobium sp. M00.F.Ca.ET.217.01.1.1]TGQ15921.1 hypothetical protein EN860_025550 [Mesorhizobium sp. M00.F.Ca.ET.217.01.1.1]TGV87142.1 hypothetical protein EN801_026490 [Mesorhizobium sp. M00.F.Ca.ET.158.01.1.1]
MTTFETVRAETWQRGKEFHEGARVEHGGIVWEALVPIPANFRPQHAEGIWRLLGPVDTKRTAEIFGDA